MTRHKAPDTESGQASVAGSQSALSVLCDLPSRVQRFLWEIRGFRLRFAVECGIMSAKGAVCVVTEEELHVALRELPEIKETLKNIERLLRKMPEIQAAVYIQMQEEADSAKFRGVSAKDLWEVCPSEGR